MSLKQDLIKLKKSLQAEAKASLIQSNNLTRVKIDRQKLKIRAATFLEIVEIIDKLI